MGKKVSIVIPCFNSQNTIRETLESVIRQSYQDWEVLCCDDGSTDKTCNIISEYTIKYPNIFLFKRNSVERGGSVCRNIGISNSEGEYLIFLDADDLLAPNCLEHRVNAMDITASKFCVFPFAYYDNGVIKEIGIDKSITNFECAFGAGHAVWQTTCPIYETSFVKMIGGFDESFQRLQDVEFGLRAIFYSNGNFSTYLVNNQADCYYRVSSCDNRKSKYRLVLTYYDSFGTLVNKLAEKGAFKKKVNLVYICLCLTAAQLFIMNGNRTIKYNEIFKSFNIKKKIGILGALIVDSPNVFSFKTQFEILYIRFVRRLIMRIFF